MQRIFLLLILTSLTTATTGLAQESAKSSPARSASSKVEPLRVASGLMTGPRIDVRRTDWINDGKPMFTYTLRSVRLVEGRLEFTGALTRPGLKTAQETVSTLITTTARSANPWPNATSPGARSRNRKPADQNTPEQERNEQTQSLHSAGETGLGCELVYLKITPPAGTGPLQVGVVLAYQDNELGNQINQEICFIVRGIKADAKVDDRVAKLNQLLAGK